MTSSAPASNRAPSAWVKRVLLFGGGSAGPSACAHTWSRQNPSSMPRRSDASAMTLKPARSPTPSPFLSLAPCSSSATCTLKRTVKPAARSSPPTRPGLGK